MIYQNRNKITFIAWSPDEASVMVSSTPGFSSVTCQNSQRLTNDNQQAKMVYASSKEALKRALTGVATELQANDADDIEFDSVLKTVSKGLAGK